MRSFLITNVLALVLAGCCPSGQFMGDDGLCHTYGEDPDPGNGVADGFCDESVGNDPDCIEGGDCDLEPNENGADLGMPGFFQQCQSWCWAAATEMIAEYYGQHADQCLMATAKANGGQGECCQLGCQGVCDQPATMQDILYLLSFHNVGGQIFNQALTEEQLQIELSSGRPVIVFMSGTFVGHFIVVGGFQPAGFSGPAAVYDFIDPFFGRFVVAYQDILFGYNNGQSQWQATITRLAPTSSGCN